MNTNIFLCLNLAFSVASSMNVYTIYPNATLKHIFCKQSDGWDDCFKYGGHASNMSNAQNLCRVIGGVLAIPYTPHDMHELCAFMLAAPKIARLSSTALYKARDYKFLGAFDTHKNHTYYDESMNKQMTILNSQWVSGQPNNLQQQCLGIDAATDSCGFHDLTCTSPSHAVCSYPIKNHCQYDNGDCGSMMCTTSEGVVSCLCKIGFHQPHKYKRTCTDIDECQSASACKNGKCKNTVGDFECDCNKGFELIGTGCVDVDECADPTKHTCAHQCINTDGGYKCKCFNGEAPDGKCRTLEWIRPASMSYIGIAVLSTLASAGSVAGYAIFILKLLGKGNTSDQQPESNPSNKEADNGPEEEAWSENENQENDKKSEPGTDVDLDDGTLDGTPEEVVE